MKKHPLKRKKFVNLPAQLIASKLKIDIIEVIEPTNKPSYVINEELIYFDSSVRTKVGLNKILPKRQRGEKRTIKQCCWDKSLFIVKSNVLFETYDGVISDTKSYNYLAYADSENLSSTTTDAGAGGGEQVRGEGTGVKVSRSNFKSDFKCEDYKYCDNSCNKNRVQVGVVDFGWGDYHADTIRHIIHSQYRGVQMHDYNLIASFGVATVLAICCQIARAINERMDILNMSIGYYSMIENELLKTYIEKAAHAGILIICSTGNSDNDNSVNKHWPSNFRFTHKNVISVSSKLLSEAVTKTGYSNYESGGDENLRVFANGMYAYPSHINLSDDNGRITHARGTSFSTAYVVGKVAKLFHRFGKSRYIAGNGFDRKKILNDINPNSASINLEAGLTASCRPV